MKKDRLFVPLCTKPFVDFRENGKTYELRVCKGNFSKKYVYTDRKVELSHGYSKNERIWGKIGEVVVGTLDEIFTEVDYKLITPRAETRDVAIEEIENYLGKKEIYIAFEVFI